MNKLIVLIFLGLVIFSCNKNEVFVPYSISSDTYSEPNLINTDSINFIDNVSFFPPDYDSINYLALGDSYTFGQGVEKFETWPKLLEKDIENEIDIEINTQIIAATGMDTKELIYAIKESKTLESYELVSLLIGVNNQFRGLKVDHFRKEFIQLIDKSIDFTNNNVNRVFVLSIPDWSATPFGQSFDFRSNRIEIDKLNKIIKMICSEKGVDYFDITEISRWASTQSSLLVEDQLHPSKKMYQLWVDKIIKDVLNKLRN
ncbi:MAG: GDSL-type esterase/lipase family protein [Flavobacteriaceae bacterium]|nr:GDSL-type esterase/lipase family protein [Flavobacteriaceae bacterium]